MIKVKSYVSVAILSLLIATPSFGRRMTNNVVFFIDYSRSTRTVEGNNKKKINRLIKTKVRDFGRDDELRVYPIHSRATTSSSLLNLTGPNVKGDLRDRQVRKEWLEEELLPGIDEALEYHFSADLLGQTNIYPLMGKIIRMKKSGTRVEVYFLSDMVHDYKNTSLKKQLKDIQEESFIIGSAESMVSVLGLENSLEGVDIYILIPALPEGYADYEDVQAKVNMYWAHFFKSCGATIEIDFL